MNVRAQIYRRRVTTYQSEHLETLLLVLGALLPVHATIRLRYAKRAGLFDNTRAPMETPMETWVIHSWIAAGHAGGTGAHGGEQQPYGGGGGGLDFVTDEFDIAREL